MPGKLFFPSLPTTHQTIPLILSWDKEVVPFLTKQGKEAIFEQLSSWPSRGQHWSQGIPTISSARGRVLLLPHWKGWATGANTPSVTQHELNPNLSQPRCDPSHHIKHLARKHHHCFGDQSHTAKFTLHNPHLSTGYQTAAEGNHREQVRVPG